MTPNDKVMILAADSTLARLFLVEGSGDTPREIVNLYNPDARQHEHDLVADRAGRRGHEPMSAGHSRFGGGSMKQHHVEDFAAAMCTRTAKAIEQTSAGGLYIVAPPTLMGLLRQRMDAGMRRHLRGEVSKSVATRTAADIRASLPDQL